MKNYKLSQALSVTYLAVLTTLSGFTLADQTSPAAGEVVQPSTVGQQPLAKPEQQYSEPTFSVPGFEIEGPELVPRRRLLEVLEPFANRELTFSDLRIATTAAEKLHALRGFEVVRVIVPEQELEPGQPLKLRIIDARLDTVLVTDNQHFSEAQLVAEFPILQPGALINTVDLDRKIRLVNTNPARTIAVALEPSFKPKSVDAVMKVTDRDPFSKAIALDNTGSGSTGDYRLGVVLQHANLFEKSHVATFQALTSPGHWSDVKVFSLGYQIPLESIDALIDFSLSDSNVQVGTINSGAVNLSITGAGKTKSVKLTKLLDRLQGMEQSVVVSYEIKDFISDVQIVGQAGGSIIPNLRSAPVSVNWVLNDPDSEIKKNFTLGYSKNISTGGNNSQAAYSLSNANSDVNFDVIRFALAITSPLPEGWSVTGKFDGQYSSDTLIPGEQFGAGGASSVRGFDERAISADKGLRQSIQFSGPNWAGKAGGSEGFGFKLLQPVAFAEAAQLRLNSPLAGSARTLQIGSVGVGVRFSFGMQHVIALDLAHVVAGEGNTRSGDYKLHFSLAVSL